MGPCTLTPRHADFEFLVDVIIGQQLSKKAADTIIQRFRNLFLSGRITVKSFLSLSSDKVFKCGLSKRKYEYLVDLAKAIESRQLRLSELNGENDEIIRTALKSIRGIGDWTVDMFLLFGLARLDVLPSHDLALRRIIVDLYGIDQNDSSIIEKLSERWKPYRSIACWYLYKHGNMKTDAGNQAETPLRN